MCAQISLSVCRPFHQLSSPKVDVFLTSNRGWGVRAAEPIPKGTFIVEYAGEAAGLTFVNDTFVAPRSSTAAVQWAAHSDICMSSLSGSCAQPVTDSRRALHAQLRRDSPDESDPLRSQPLTVAYILPCIIYHIVAEQEAMQADGWMCTNQANMVLGGVV